MAPSAGPRRKKPLESVYTLFRDFTAVTIVVVLINSGLEGLEFFQFEKRTCFRIDMLLFFIDLAASFLKKLDAIERSTVGG